MKNFVNTMLGLPYVPKGDSIDTHVLAQRAIAYPKRGEGEQQVELIPKPASGLLTAGVDVQGDRLELVVWGWGAGGARWLIAWEQLHGDPGAADVWLELERWRLVQTVRTSREPRSRSRRCASTPATCRQGAPLLRWAAAQPRAGDHRQGRPGPQAARGAGREEVQARGQEAADAHGRHRLRKVAALMSALRVPDGAPGERALPRLDRPGVLRAADQRAPRHATEARPRGARVGAHPGPPQRSARLLVYAEAALTLVGKDVRAQLAEIVLRVNEAGAAIKRRRDAAAERASGRPADVLARDRVGTTRRCAGKRWRSHTGDRRRAGQRRLIAAA
jgi:hypothetical protein